MNFGWKTFNDECSLFSWHSTLADARGRVNYEKRLFGRELRIARVLECEFEHARRVRCFDRAEQVRA